MSQPFIGTIILLPFNFAPRGWAFCNGQLMLINQNTALFSLLGTTYGGNGTVTFALPDLRGRAAVSAGQGPNLSVYDLGQQSGSENVTLLATQLPLHAHPVSANLKATVNVLDAAGNKQGAAGNVLANEAAGVTATYSNAAFPVPPTAKLRADAVTMSGITDPAGGGQPVSVLQPTLTLNYCIALQGIFPARN